MDRIKTRSDGASGGIAGDQTLIHDMRIQCCRESSIAANTNTSWAKPWRAAAAGLLRICRQLVQLCKRD